MIIETIRRSAQNPKPIKIPEFSKNIINFLFVNFMKTVNFYNVIIIKFVKKNNQHKTRTIIIRSCT